MAGATQPHLRINTNKKGVSRRGGFLPSPGRKLNFTIDNGRIHNVSLGQGQEAVAERALEVAAAQGHWVILQVGGGAPGRTAGHAALLATGQTGAHHGALSPASRQTWLSVPVDTKVVSGMAEARGVSVTAPLLPSRCSSSHAQSRCSAHAVVGSRLVLGGGRAGSREGTGGSSSTDSRKALHCLEQGQREGGQGGDTGGSRKQGSRGGECSAPHSLQ